MKWKFTARIERDGEWFIATTPEVPGANGQGRTREECVENLAEAIELIQLDRGGSPRSGWEDAFAEMHARGDDVLLDGDVQGLSSWDEEEWEWD